MGSADLRVLLGVNEIGCWKESRSLCWLWLFYMDRNYFLFNNLTFYLTEGKYKDKSSIHVPRQEFGM